MISGLHKLVGPPVMLNSCHINAEKKPQFYPICCLTLSLKVLFKVLIYWFLYCYYFGRCEIGVVQNHNTHNAPLEQQL